MTETIYLAMGCFWGVEKLFTQQHGVVDTAVGYQGGQVANPSYELVCTGTTGHTETVRVSYDPQQISVADLLTVFWENHDPTQGDRQGNDIGSQYRSAIFWTTPEQRDAALASRDAFATRLATAGYGAVTTQIESAAQAGSFYLAEEYHQQYLAKNPLGYCPVHATGVRCS